MRFKSSIASADTCASSCLNPFTASWYACRRSRVMGRIHCTLSYTFEVFGTSNFASLASASFQKGITSLSLIANVTLRDLRQEVATDESPEAELESRL